MSAAPPDQQTDPPPSSSAPPTKTVAPAAPPVATAPTILVNHTYTVLLQHADTTTPPFPGLVPAPAAVRTIPSQNPSRIVVIQGKFVKEMINGRQLQGRAEHLAGLARHPFPENQSVTAQEPPVLPAAPQTAIAPAPLHTAKPPPKHVLPAQKTTTVQA